MAKKAAKKMPATQAEVTAIAVRLDLTPTDHQRLNHQARKRGLTKASCVRMIILEWLTREEGGSK